MGIIKRRVLLEDGISRKSDTSYGLMTATSFNFKVMLTQTIDDMGMFTDIEYVDEVPDYTILVTKLLAEGLTFPFMTGATPASVVLTGFTSCTRYDGAVVNDWYADGDQILAYTESRVTQLKSYNKNDRYIPNFNIGAQVYNNYNNQLINGVDRVIDVTTGQTGSTVYVFDTNDDVFIGTTGQTTGFRMIDPNNVQPLFPVNEKIFSTNKTITNTNDDTSQRPNIFTTPEFHYKAEGWNNTNTSLSALTKEKYLMGITSPPEVSSNVFIDRGATTVMEMHLKLSEVESIEHMEWYGNGFYNLTKI